MSAKEAAEITHAFHRWMVDRRQTGKRIAVDDIWVEAQEFAHARGIRLPKENRFREFLARTPGVAREYDVRIDGEPKTTSYTFNPIVGASQDEFVNWFDSAALGLNSR
ncbi:hypothetical protein [Hyphomicrobium sp.]|uniref:hypothetical protein n=1 Tax=Hyphomicrobium sp. TaxID=82 RepID=UPI001DF3E0A5|nr:hypothetical protein [Hyphomicrobium sp.]MBY0558865.1 hypothetical protein [Hyphomicrobium sp.]